MRRYRSLSAAAVILALCALAGAYFGHTALAAQGFDSPADVRLRVYVSHTNYCLAATHTDRKAVDGLAIVYHQQPLNLAKLVYEQPSEPLKTFSDAFRVWPPKDKKDK